MSTSFADLQKQLQETAGGAEFNNPPTFGLVKPKAEDVAEGFSVSWVSIETTDRQFDTHKKPNFKDPTKTSHSIIVEGKLVGFGGKTYAYTGSGADKDEKDPASLIGETVTVWLGYIGHRTATADAIGTMGDGWKPGQRFTFATGPNTVATVDRNGKREDVTVGATGVWYNGVHFPANREVDTSLGKVEPPLGSNAAVAPAPAAAPAAAPAPAAAVPTAPASNTREIAQAGLQAAAGASTEVRGDLIEAMKQAQETGALRANTKMPDSTDAEFAAVWTMVYDQAPDFAAAPAAAPAPDVDLDEEPF